MKTSVVINDGKTEIILKPENEFEVDIIEKVTEKNYKFKETKASTDFSYGEYKNHKIIIEIEKK